MSKEIAILHDQLRTRGGAERVAFELARTFDAPIYAARVDEGVPPGDVETHQLPMGRLGKKAMHSHYLLQDIFQMDRWQYVEDLYQYDTVILNKTNPAWFVPKDRQTTVWYVHSTPRGMYDQFHRHGGTKISRAMNVAQRCLYQPNTRYADAWICNSELVQRRLERYWDIDPEDVDVVYPPVDLDGLEPHGSDGNFYVTVSRLRDHKRIDQLVEAFRGLDAQLLVAGDGPERDDLEEQAPENVEFLGYVDESHKSHLLNTAKACLFNAENEDFGLVPVESMAAGTPVLGVREGFTQHQILDGENGYTFDRGVKNIREAIARFEAAGVAWESEEIHEFATQFGSGRFREEMRALVEETREETTVRAPWEESDGIAIEFDEPTPAPARPDGGGSNE